MAREASLQQTEGGLVPAGQGWFVVNAREARWVSGMFGAFTRFEGPGAAAFDRLGINITVLDPDQPSSLYHGENEQEDFLVLSGECRLLVDGQERRLRAWDFVHCPPWTEHVFIGAGAGPSVLLAVGTRSSDEVIYPVHPPAQAYGASATQPTTDPEQAYRGLPDDVVTPFQDSWLPEAP